MELYRSLKPEFKPYIILEGNYWTLLVDKNQRYLGRSYLWLVRPGEMQDYFDLLYQEECELRRLGSKFRSALKRLWKPDLMNYGWYGNLVDTHGGHGHMHLIPRYKEQRSFAGVNFLDTKWGQHYKPHPDKFVSDEILFKIRDAIRNEMITK